MTDTPQMTAVRAAAILIDCGNHGTISPEAIGLLNGYLHALADECDRLSAISNALDDEYGILDDGGGDRQVTTEPIPLRTWNAALSVELRAKGVFNPGGRRPARLMQRKVTGWTEIPLEVWPQDIFPGYVARESGTQREVEI